MLYCLYCGVLLPAPPQPCPVCGSGDPSPAQVLDLLRAAGRFVPRYGPAWNLHRAIALALARPRWPRQRPLFPEARPGAAQHNDDHLQEAF
jgi:hypothetical protein